LLPLSIFPAFNRSGRCPMNCYEILSFSSLDELTGEVNQKWQEGWRPQGGLAVLQGETGYIFLQAIARIDEETAINFVPKRIFPERRDIKQMNPV
jgi:hypothetical protein